ncbi:MAG TPA: HAMP domain-containing sensor histidine kinase [Microbacterium sp.]|nr:HAMP domain-containing sensor histidine kinase [Microbacterium sp.]
MANKTDAVTRWWRGVSLRAKVTGVTVAVLAIGLVATGVGASVFLRTALIQNLDNQLEQLASADLASGLVEVDPTSGAVTARPDTVQTDYFLALYGPEGEFLISVDGSGPAPDFPETWTPLATNQRGTEPFSLSGTTSAASFHASVGPQQFPGLTGLFSQMVAMPLAPIDRVVNTFLGIYGILALITIIGAALITRLLVTLTFRSLGQVETTAMAIAAGDFTQRLTDVEPKTEVGKLKLAINTMLNRVDGALAQRDTTVRQMRRFIGDASHELRTPLVSVRGYAELYRMGAISGEEDTAQAMERIEKEAIRMGMLVEDLLALARLDEKRDVVIEPVDLRPVARDVALDVRAAAPERVVTVIDTTIATDAPPPPAAPEEPEAHIRRRATPPTSAIARAGATTLSLLRRRPRPVPASEASTAIEDGRGSLPLASPSGDDADGAGSGDAAGEPAPADDVPSPPIVLGDENRIRQVVTNLVTNARRYTPVDSPIELAVGVDAHSRTGWIAVVDHGEGIPDPLKERIFQRFWRADTSRARETGGSGLGLSIVSSIVDALHGSVMVADTPGGGATFRAAFPLATARDASEHLLIETQPLRRLGADEA